MTAKKYKKLYPGGSFWSKESRAALEGNSRALGHRKSEAFKRRLSIATSKPRSREVREKIRQGHLRRRKVNPRRVGTYS